MNHIYWLEFILATAAGILLGLPLALATTRRMRKSKNFRMFALLAAGLFSFFTYRDPRETSVIAESESETRRKRENEDGDPPDPAI